MATTTTTTGLNVSGISKIKSAIESYKKKVVKQADNIGAKKSLIKSAIQGDNTLKNLDAGLGLIETQIKNLLNDLNVYSDYLDQLKGTYKSHDNANEPFAHKAIRN